MFLRATDKSLFRGQHSVFYSSTVARRQFVPSAMADTSPPGIPTLLSAEKRGSAVVPRISELPLPESAPESEPSGALPTPTPRTALENAAKVRTLEEKVKMLEAQLDKVAPKTWRSITGRSGADGDTGSQTSSVYTPSNMRGSTSPIPDDSTELFEELEQDEDAAAAAYGDGGEDDGDEVPEEIEGPAPLDASIHEARLPHVVDEIEDESDGPESPGFQLRPMTADMPPLTADEIFIAKVTANLGKVVAGRKPIVLVSTGAYNPVHLQHVRMFYLARKVRKHLMRLR